MINTYILEVFLYVDFHLSRKEIVTSTIAFKKGFFTLRVPYLKNAAFKKRCYREIHELSSR